MLDNERVDDLCARAGDLGLKTHLDGARLANASAASGLSLAKLSAGFDSVMIDFAKGLGAPVGAAVAGSAAWIERAPSVRRLLGGAIHQPGFLAVACLHGLEGFPPRLKDDHRKARMARRSSFEALGRRSRSRARRDQHRHRHGVG